MAFADLSPLDLGRLRMSVGYGTHKKGRPLSPIEVARLLRRAIEGGTSLDDCAKSLKLQGTSQLVRFLKILDLPQDLQHLIGWGQSADSIGFTTAVELVRIPDRDDQSAIASAILEQGLQTDEVRQIAQLLRRSGRSVEDCLKEVVGMRPTIERRYVFIGTIGDREVRAALSSLTQAERNGLLSSGLQSIGIVSASGRLGEQLFTVVGDERLNRKLSSLGRETIETHLRAHIKERIANVPHEG